MRYLFARKIGIKSTETDYEKDYITFVMRADGFVAYSL